MFFDAMKLKHENLKQFPLVKINLFDSCRLFDEGKGSGTGDFLNLNADDPKDVKLQTINGFRNNIVTMMESGDAKCFKFQPEEALLYSIIHNKSG